MALVGIDCRILFALSCIGTGNALPATMKHFNRKMVNQALMVVSEWLWEGNLKWIVVRVWDVTMKVLEHSRDEIEMFTSWFVFYVFYVVLYYQLWNWCKFKVDWAFFQTLILCGVIWEYELKITVSSKSSNADNINTGLK